MIRLGLFGGRFDPVHRGHLAAARAAMAQYELARVIFIPAPDGTGRRASVAPAAERLAMLRCAIAGEPSFEVSDVELSAGAPAFTVETVRRIREMHELVQLFWILGSDHLRTIDSWRGIDELARSVEFIAVERAGHPIDTKSLPRGLVVHACAAAVPCSSSAIRRRLGGGWPVGDAVCEAVARHIAARRLYT